MLRDFFDKSHTMKHTPLHPLSMAALSIALLFLSVSCNKANDKLVSVDVYPVIQFPTDSTTTSNLLKDVDVRVMIMENDRSVDTLYMCSDNFNRIPKHHVRNLQDGVKVSANCTIKRTDPTDSLYFQLSIRALMYFSDGTTHQDDRILSLGYPYCTTSSNQIAILQGSTTIIRFVGDSLVIDE